MIMNTRNKFSILVQNYFYKNLINQRRVSERTVKSYRDAFCLLFKFTSEQLGKKASELCLSDIDADLVVKFLDYLEVVRKNTVSSRNARLAAIRSFLHYAAYQEPSELPNIQRVLAIPIKRHDHKLVGFLSREEMTAILDSIDKRTWSGQRDHVLLTTLYNTGARVSEIIAVKRSEVEVNNNGVIYLHGKGRKDRSIPLWKSTKILIRAWLAKINKDLQSPLFPNRFGNAMTRSGVNDRIKSIIKKAAVKCQSLKVKKISPHVIRHTTAMHLLQSGVDLTVIALWLGHESIATTHRYMEADLKMKERVLASLQDPKQRIKRKPLSDSLITFLEGL